MPETARALTRMLLEQITALTERIDAPEKEIRRRAPKGPEVARLMTIPGVGAICATAVKAFCPSMTQFRSGRDFAAWVGLAPRQISTGGKTRLEWISKLGQRDIRRLLIIGASAVVYWAARKGASTHGAVQGANAWLSGMSWRNAPATNCSS